MKINPVRGAVDAVANSRGRSLQHIAVGLGLTAGAVALSALIARMNAPTPDNEEVYSDYEELVQPAAKPPPAVFALIWPPLFMALTLSGLRIWNAPKSAARTQALTLWGMVQALNAVWMALGPRRLGGQLSAAIGSLGASAAYVWRARKVDPPAANMVAPYVGWIGFANVLTEELWRKNPGARTVH
jgi:tryptophan-rich sensory protein